jgi:chromosome segregation ATPase
MLNKARIESLKDLEQVHRDRDELQFQVNVLQLKLAETEARLKTSVQEKSKIKLLEQEVETLQERLSEGKELQNSFSQQNADYVELSRNVEKLKAEAGKSDSLTMEIEKLAKENVMLQRKLESLQSKLVDSNRKDEIITQLLSEKDSIEKARAEAEKKLGLAETKALELAKLELEEQVTRENLQASEKGKNSLVTNSRGGVESQTVRDRFEQLQSQLLKLEAENETLKHAQLENEVLRSQIGILEQCLADSDADIRSQLQVYQAEVESFQNTIEQLKAVNSVSPVVDDMPWEFWSSVLLSLDGWLLEKKLLFEDATALRELAWKRDSSIKDAFLTRKEATDDVILSGLEELLRKKKRYYNCVFPIISR